MHNSCKILPSRLGWFFFYQWRLWCCCIQVIPFYLPVYNIHNIMILKEYYFVDIVLIMCMGENNVYMSIKAKD